MDNDRHSQHHDSQHLHLHLHLSDETQRFLSLFFQCFEHKLDHLIHLGEKLMATLDDVVSKVTDLGTVEDSVIALLTDIKAKLDAAIASGADPVKLQALSDALDAQKQRLADAVVANTPSA